MNLADHIIAAAGGPFDPAAGFALIADQVKKAQRFELHDDVVRACTQLYESKPSTLMAVLPLCRMPYPKMWIEYRGGVNKNNRDPKVAPIPQRQGFLIESFTPKEVASVNADLIKHISGLVGWATIAWVHKNLPGTDDGEYAPNFSPFALYFDWSEHADVKRVIKAMHRAILATLPARESEALSIMIASMEKQFFSDNEASQIARFLATRPGWEKFKDDQKEIEALRMSDRNMLPGVSTHGALLLARIIRNAPADKLQHVISNWLGDMQGEGPFMETVLAMMNSKNCVRHEPVDLGKLNKARAKRGKGPLLNFTTTKLTLSRAQRNVADASGISRDAARQHLVRGHFKIRSTGVYWWSPFLRGRAGKGTIERKQYEVAQ